MLRNFGNRAHEMWDLTTPEKPVRLAVLVEKLKDTHKSWWECDSGIAYLVSGLGDWRTRRMTQVFDLSDPVHPRFIRNFGLVGQQPGRPSCTGSSPPGRRATAFISATAPINPAWCRSSTGRS